jgi:tetratricopeptide (TPR) repeat protein
VDENGLNDQLGADFDEYAGDFSFAGGSKLSDQTGQTGHNGSAESAGQLGFFSEELEALMNAEQPPDQERSLNGIASEKPESESSVPDLKLADELKLQKEIESVEFYIAQGYTDLAIKCMDSIEENFGPRKQITEYRKQLGLPERVVVEDPEPAGSEDAQSTEADEMLETFVREVQPENVFEQFRSELGLDDSEKSEESDYSTHYQMAIAYKEMGLMEEAIKEFQDAINLVEINDGTPRFVQCANLLGHCFMVKGMPNLALTWYKRALETINLNEDEIRALNYELANAYEASGEKEKAFQYFEQVYALDVDYRDISQRIQTLRENYSSL